MRRLPRALLVLALVLLGAIVAGCDDGAGRWVERAAADSAAAEQALDRGDAEAARRHLRALVNRAVPSDVAERDARVVRQDAYDRLARLALAAGDVAQARRQVEAGLALGEGDDVFTANLLTTRGRVHEAAGRDLEAARDYHRALEINDTLLDRALGETP